MKLIEKGKEYITKNKQKLAILALSAISAFSANAQDNDSISKADRDFYDKLGTEWKLFEVHPGEEAPVYENFQKDAQKVYNSQNPKMDETMKQFKDYMREMKERDPDLYKISVKFPEAAFNAFIKLQSKKAYEELTPEKAEKNLEKATGVKATKTVKATDNLDAYNHVAGIKPKFDGKYYYAGEGEHMIKSQDQQMFKNMLLSSYRQTSATLGDYQMLKANPEHSKSDDAFIKNYEGSLKTLGLEVDSKGELGVAKQKVSIVKAQSNTRD